jgi:hypothetical protein
LAFTSSTDFLTWKELSWPYSCYKCICICICIHFFCGVLKSQFWKLDWVIDIWVWRTSILCHKLQGYQHPHIVLLVLSYTNDAIHKPNGTSKWRS